VEPAAWRVAPDPGDTRPERTGQVGDAATRTKAITGFARHGTYTVETGMEKSRVTIALRLFLLLGLPFLVILGLFTFGVRLGVHNRDFILGFEERVLGFEVDRGEGEGEPKDGEADEKDDGDDDAKKDDAADSDADEPGKDDADEKDATSEDRGPPPDARDPAAKDPADAPPRVTPPSVPGTVAAELPPIAARPTPPDDLVGALATTRVITVKVLVDATTVEAHPDWVDYVQRLISLSSANYTNLFGVQLRLYGVMQWDVSSNPLHADDFLQLVKEQPRDGADVLIALTDREMVDGVGGSSEVWPDGANKNGAYAVVYGSSERKEPHLQGTMHELAHLLGAKDVIDSSSGDFRGDNFMSYAAHDQSAPPMIDAANLRRVLTRKSQPFVSNADHSSHDGSPR